MESIGLKAAPRRRYGSKVQWVVVLDTGRFGDWIVVEVDRTATEEDVLKSLTRAQRRKALSVKLVRKFDTVEDANSTPSRTQIRHRRGRKFDTVEEMVTSTTKTRRRK